MPRSIITPAALDPLALAELKAWLGITNARDDPELIALLRAALDLCEQYTGLLPLAATCEEILTATPEWRCLSARPVIAITGIEGIPADGPRIVLPVAAYAIELDADSIGRVRTISPGSAGRIAVRFTAGLAPGWGQLPDGLRHGILRLAAHQHRTREDDRAAPLPPAAVAALWRPWRRITLQ